MIDIVKNLQSDARALLAPLRHPRVRRKKRASQSKARDYAHGHVPFAKVPKTTSFDPLSGSVRDDGKRGVNHSYPG